jgi:hypothetical protein
MQMAEFMGSTMASKLIYATAVDGHAFMSICTIHNIIPRGGPKEIFLLRHRHTCFMLAKQINKKSTGQYFDLVN